MQFRKAYRFRLEPKGKAYEALLHFSGYTRFVWNWMLNQRQELYKATGKGTNYFNQANQLKFLKQFYPWLNDCPSQALQQSLKDLDRAYQNFFQGRAKIPKFKRRGQHDSFRIPQGIEVEGNRVKLPKLGWMKFRKSRAIEGKIKNATLSKQGKHWFISFCCEVEVKAEPHPSPSAVGIDVGIARLAMLSDGTAYDGIQLQRRHAKKLKRLQRFFSRKRRGSANWRYSRERLLKLHIKIANTRRDYLHKVTTEISKSHAMVFVEDLKVITMSKSGERKSNLNRMILDQSWGEFFRQLEYKQGWLGGSLYRVDPKYTSQQCSRCGHTVQKNRKTQADFKCQQCGYKENADLNAALNILAAGHAVLACGVIRQVAA